MKEDTKLMIMAPVVANRKGEHSDLFESMQAQGFVRFRIQSGTHVAKIYEIDDLPKLKKTEKHTIDVVIDRVKVNPEIKQRLAESFEAALRLADGRALAVEMDAPPDGGTPTPTSLAAAPREHLRVEFDNIVRK